MRKGVATAMALLSIVIPLLPTAAGHPHHLQVSNELANAPERVESGNWIAQSFLATSDFFVSRVSLFVADTGTSDSLGVSIRRNEFSFPASTPLSQGTADGPSSQGWLAVDLDPYVPLTAGNSYWIVARSSASGNDGYDWWSSGTDTAYLDGTGVTSTDGFLWSPRGRDFTFQVYGFVQPVLSFSSSVANSTVRVGGMTTVTVNLLNEGPGTAQAVWVNITLPPELSYVADDAPAAGGTLNGTYSYAFTDLDRGSRSFNMTFQAATGVVNGTTVNVRVAINSMDHNGATLTPVIRNFSVEIVGGPDVPPQLPEGLWWWPIPIMFALATGGILLWRRRFRSVVVDEVFVADQHGLLLAHRSASMVRYQDEDVLIGMFKAVQDFVKDTFSRGTAEEFHALEFGERRILIERGRAHFIAVVYRGQNKQALMDRARKVSRAIDEHFGSVIESWNGDVDAIKGISHLLPQVWARRT